MTSADDQTPVPHAPPARSADDVQSTDVETTDAESPGAQDTGRLSDVDRARLRLAWAGSRQRRVAAWVSTPVAAVVGFLVVVAIKILVLGRPPSVAKFVFTQPLWWLFAAFAAIYAGLGAYAVSRVSFNRRFLARQTLGLKAEEVRRADLDVQSEASPEFAALWRATQTRLDYYHQIATTQSQRSFIAGQVAALAGFIVVVLSAVAAALSTNTGAAIAAAVAGVAGGGLGGYIGATFMRAQDSASAQLRAYFDQPLEMSRMLAAERLLDRLDDGHRQQSLQEIIRAVMQTPPALPSPAGPIPTESGD